mgnify:FL=1|jgi:hypothetical protein|tara:strand:+ start:288 stop:494 length:207 start_codon:yes stop_codon:yes gene_type:complete
MDEETLNLEIRKFLKNVGITSQREIEKKIRDAIEAGTIKGTEELNVEMTLDIEKVNLQHKVSGIIKLN